MGVRSPHPPAQIAGVVSQVLRALAVCAPAVLIDVRTAAAQVAAAPTLTADIPAQPLAQALLSLASQTGLQIAYVSGIVRDQKGRAVAAGQGVAQALARMLEGTGLTFVYLTPHSVRILAADTKGTGRTTADEAAAEVIVTANRRTQSLEDVPMSVQVLTGETLGRLNASTFEDFVGYLPAVTAHGVGPAQNTIYIRGLGTGEFPNQAAGTNGAFPNVAVYLDEQSAQLPGRNLDVYAADLERIEVLEGPQGTLFGAGAEAGVLRYITNKPRLDVTEVSANAAYGVTAHGDPSSAVDAMINLPLIADRLAVRAVIYSDRRGGYIDNTPATFARLPTDLSISYAGGMVPANSVVINNGALAANNINPLTYQGVRLQALYQVNDAWSVLLAQSSQTMLADGVFAQMAADSQGQPQPDLTVQLFNPSYNKDRFENTALTVKGHLGSLEVVYAGSYLVRNVDQVQDYTNYARGGAYADYYQCIDPGPTAASAQCFTPSSHWRDQERNTHQSHELRFASPDTGRLRGLGGLFYEDYRIQDQGDWFYLSALPYFYPIAPPTGYCIEGGKPAVGCSQGDEFVPGPVTSNNPHVRPLGDGFFNDITRGYRQEAAFASVDIDLVPHRLTLTAGTRYFTTHTWQVGSLVGSFGCELSSDPPNPCINRYAVDLNALGLERTYSGFRSRASLAWRVDPEAMLYYAWSQGFRSGGFNRGYAVPGDSPLSPGQASYQAQAKHHGGWVSSLTYGPDNLTNNELGWKSIWWRQRLRWNGALYQEDWTHAQVGAPDGSVVGDGVINGGNYRVRGIETSATARLGDGLSLEIGANWSHSALVREATFYWVDGMPIDFSSLRTAHNDPVANPAGTLRSALAGSPAFQGNLRARYELALDGYDAFAQFNVVHQAHSLSSTDSLTLDLQGNSTAYDLPAFTTCSAALGAGRDGWLVELAGDNLTDTRAQLYANYHLYYKAVTMSRPRTIELRLGYKFNGT
jgi:iron complex outermembrane recepter protein